MATLKRKQELLNDYVTLVTTTGEFKSEPTNIGTEANPHYTNGWGTYCKPEATITEKEGLNILKVNGEETISYIFKTLNFKKWFPTKDHEDLKKIVLNLTYLLRHTKYIDRNLFSCVEAILDGQATYETYKHAIATYVNSNETEKLADLAKILDFWGDRSTKDPRK